MCPFQTQQLCEQITDVKHRTSNTQDDMSVATESVSEQLKQELKRPSCATPQNGRKIKLRPRSLSEMLRNP